MLSKFCFYNEFIQKTKKKMQKLSHSVVDPKLFLDPYAISRVITDTDSDPDLCSQVVFDPDSDPGQNYLLILFGSR